MAYLAPLQFIFTTSILSISLRVAQLSPSCTSDQFACADGSKCISKAYLCSGFKNGCSDRSHNFPSHCDNCSAEHLFRCQLSGVDFCLNAHFRCDGKKHCTSAADELVSETVCPNCDADPSLFSCRSHGHLVCLAKQRYQCDGKFDCDDGSDELPSVCDNCTRPGLSLCRDGSRCIKTSYLCDFDVNCADGSDESDSWSNCTYCRDKGSLSCPGFPLNCAKLCDGRTTCPDAWDELLSSCKSKLSPGKGLESVQNRSGEPQTAKCSKEAGLHKCQDGSRCLRRWQVCNRIKDCTDGSDESAASCKDKCQSKLRLKPLISCDEGSCIRFNLACSGVKQPLCNDGTDMSDSLCKRKCYSEYPGIEDPYRWPCANGTKMCILQTSRCNGYPDCDDADELNYSSDEQNCPLVIQIGMFKTLLLGLAILELSWILFLILIACSRSLEKDLRSEDIILATSNSDPTSSTPPIEQALPTFLLHPALSDIDGQHCWQELGEELRLEVVFFNRDPRVLYGFLYHIEVQDAKPDNIYSAFQGFFSYVQSKGYDPITVALSMRQTIGHHRLAHMALRGSPNFTDRRLFQLKRWVRGLETRGKPYFFMARSLRALKNSVSPFLLVFDYVKDMVLYLILKETVQRLEVNCKHLSALGIDCLVASGAEQDLLTGLLITFCISIILTSINSFYLRKRFFNTNFWLNFVFGLVSPLLPAIYHIRLNQMKLELDSQKTKLCKDALRRKEKEIETLSNSIQQTKEIKVGLEAVIQILLLLGLVTFYPYVFKAPSGRSYSYFFGVTLLMLKGNKVLFLCSLFVSFLGPCMFYVNRTNVLRHGSLNVSRKLVLMARNVLFLLVRVLAITSAIFIPVINQWGMITANHGLDASSLLDDQDFRLEFQKYFSKGLDALTANIRKNSHFFLLFLFVHLLLVASHSLIYSAKFGKSMMRERVMHLVSSFWLPLPFLTVRGVDRGEEKAELWFLVGLHSIENFAIVCASRLVYLRDSYPSSIVKFDGVLVLLNLMGVLLSMFYVSKKELYAGLPKHRPPLPSFGTEVSF